MELDAGLFLQVADDAEEVAGLRIAARAEHANEAFRLRAGRRGKKLVVLVGQRKAVAIAVRNVSGRRRWSKLSEWLASKKSVDPDNTEGGL